MSHFQFKRFSLQQAGSAMKITTHACVLGAFAPVSQARRLLDIGTGCGLLALMAAQRTEANQTLIDAVELDPQAAAEADGNAKASPWSERVRVHAQAIQDFQAIAPYDCILSNPPFFEAQPLNQDSRLAQARHTLALSHAQLLMQIQRLLSPDGQAWLLLPAEALPSFAALTVRQGLQLSHQVGLRATPGKPIRRLILGLGRQVGPIQQRELILQDPHPQYHPEVRALLSPYYLKL